MKMCQAIASITLACLCALGVGCHSSKDKVSKDAIAVPDIDAVPATPQGKLGYRLDWQGFPGVSGTTAMFRVMGDTIAVLDSRNNMTVMDSSTGRNRWSVTVGHRLERIVGIDRFNDQLVVCSETTCQIFDIKTGQLNARQKLSALANTPIVIVRDIAIMGCSNGEVLGHSLSTGFRAWGYMLSGAVTAAPVVLAGYDVGVVSQAGDVIILDASTGSARGRLTTIFGGLANNPAASENFLFVASLDQSVYAFSRDSGQRAWRFRTESRIKSQPVYDSNRVYITLEREGLVCLDAATGEHVWANADVRGVVFASHNDALLVRDGDTIYRLRPDTGATIEKVDFPGIAFLGTDAFGSGPIYTIGKRGLVQKFVPAF